MRSILTPLLVSAGLLVVSSASAYVLCEDSSVATVATIERTSPAVQVETTAAQIDAPVRHGSSFHCEGPKDAIDVALLARDRIQIRTAHATSTGELMEGDALLHSSEKSSLRFVRLDERVRDRSPGSVQLTFVESGDATAVTYACGLID